uniref:TNF receptor-associated factor 5 n=1 Tax=Haemonchus contortus TaxID=6289 RepID=A0A7I5E8Y1_HAECO
MQKHADSCLYHGVPCPNCKKTVPERDMATHLEECEKKIGTCTYCGIRVKATGMEKHLKICPRVIMSCPFQCGLLDRTREEVCFLQINHKTIYNIIEIEQHRPSCPNIDKYCPFAELGCDYTGDKETIPQHLAEEPVHHLMLLCDAITDLKSFHTTVQSEWYTTNERHQSLLERAITANEMYGAQLIWRIDNMEQKMNEARSGTRPIIHSDPFVSGRYGYKFVASACLFGDGQYRGKYMAVYVTLVRGKYDSLLQWPFDLTVCITLLDQNPVYENRCDISYRVDARKIKDKCEFLERPMTDKNGSFGAQTFCRLAVMDNFIREDTMFLKIEIDVLKSHEHLLRPASVTNPDCKSAISELPPRTPVTVSQSQLPETTEEMNLGDETEPSTTLPSEESWERPPTVKESAPNSPISARSAGLPVIVSEENEIQENGEIEKSHDSKAHEGASDRPEVGAEEHEHE